MRVTHGGIAGSPATDLNRSFELTSANTGGGRRYQKRFTIDLPTGGVAEGLVVLETTGIRVTSSGYGFNALDSQAPERAEVSRTDDGKGLLVELPVARTIDSVRFHAIAAPTGKKTQLFRTDGDVISEDPVGTAGSAASGVLQTKAARGGAVARRPAAPAATVASERLFADTAMIRTLGGGLGVLDSRIVVRLRGASDFDNLDVTSLAELNLDAAPENFRVGVGLPALGAELFYLPLELEPGVAVDASFELRTQLEDLVNRLRDGLAAGAEEIAAAVAEPAHGRARGRE